MLLVLHSFPTRRSSDLNQNRCTNPSFKTECTACQPVVSDRYIHLVNSMRRRSAYWKTKHISLKIIPCYMVTNRQPKTLGHIEHIRKQKTDKHDVNETEHCHVRISTMDYTKKQSRADIDKPLFIASIRYRPHDVAAEKHLFKKCDKDKNNEKRKCQHCEFRIG